MARSLESLSREILGSAEDLAYEQIEEKLVRRNQHCEEQWIFNDLVLPELNGLYVWVGLCVSTSLGCALCPAPASDPEVATGKHTGVPQRVGEGGTYDSARRIGKVAGRAGGLIRRRHESSLSGLGRLNRFPSLDGHSGAACWRTGSHGA
ncbi:hypothetical protein BST61_g2249 [Cercospora zeina]